MQLWNCLPINLAGDEVSIVGGGVGADLAQMTRTSPLSLPQPTPANMISILLKNKKKEKKSQKKDNWNHPPLSSSANYSSASQPKLEKEDLKKQPDKKIPPIIFVHLTQKQ